MNGEKLTEQHILRLNKNHSTILQKYASDRQESVGNVIRRAVLELLGRHSYLSDDEKKAWGLTE